MSGSDRSNIFPWPGTMFLTGGAGASGIAAITGGVIANTAISGGTIDGTAITNSTMDGTSIGAYDPDTGRFTSLEVLGLSTLGRNSANYITVAGGNTVNPVLITPTGSDTNTDLRFNPKGQGVVHSDRASVGTFAASSTYPANRVFTAFTIKSMSGSAPGSVYRFGGGYGGTVTASITGLYVHAVDSDAVNFGDNAMTVNYQGHTLSAGWGGGRTTHQSYMFISAEGTASGLSGGSRYMVSGSAMIEASASLGGGNGDQRGNIFARNDRSRLRNGAGYHVNSVIGNETDVGVVATAETAIKGGIKVVLESDDTNRGWISDWAYGASVVAQTGTGATSQGWRVGWALGGYEAWYPFTASSRVMALVRTAASISAGAPSYLLGGGIDFRGITISDASFSAPGFYVDGSGNLGALLASGETLQTRGSITANTAVANTVSVIEPGLYVGAITLTGSAPPGGGTTAQASVATFSFPYVQSIDTRGSGYAVNDTIALVGGTSSVQATGIVTRVDGTGAVYGIKLTQPGNYSVAPSAPVATTTGGGGSGLTLTPMRAILTVTVTNPGTNYSEWLPPTWTSSGATTTYRQAVLKTAMTPTQVQLQLNSGKINVTGIPTSSAGLASGDVYSNAGVLTVVP